MTVEKRRAEDAFSYLEVDCDAKPRALLLGQVCHNRQRVTKRSQASPYSDQLRAAHIARGARGDALLSDPTFSGNIAVADIRYMDKFTDAVEALPCTSAHTRTTFPSMRRRGKFSVTYGGARRARPALPSR